VIQFQFSTSLSVLQIKTQNNHVFAKSHNYKVQYSLIDKVAQLHNTKKVSVKLYKQTDTERDRLKTKIKEERQTETGIERVRHREQEHRK
ncbi:hypothetical protein ScPMuIL_005786, partial [Solemya velum]